MIYRESFLFVLSRQCLRENIFVSVIAGAFVAPPSQHDSKYLQQQSNGDSDLYIVRIARSCDSETPPCLSDERLITRAAVLALDRHYCLSTNLPSLVVDRDNRFHRTRVNRVRVSSVPRRRAERRPHSLPAAAAEAVVL